MVLLSFHMLLIADFPLPFASFRSSTFARHIMTSELVDKCFGTHNETRCQMPSKLPSSDVIAGPAVSMTRKYEVSQTDETRQFISPWLLQGHTF